MDRTFFKPCSSWSTWNVIPTPKVSDKTILYIPQADGITNQKLPPVLRCIMFDPFGIHQNVLTQELFELFINYYKFHKQAICNRPIWPRICLCRFDSNIMLEVKIKFRLKAFKLELYWFSILSQPFTLHEQLGREEKGNWKLSFDLS